MEENAFSNISSSSFLFDPLIEIESDVEQLTHALMNEGLYIEDEKLVKEVTGLGDAICTIHQMEGLNITKKVDVEVTRVDKNNDEGVSFEDMTHVVSQNNTVTNETRGDKGSNIDVAKLDNKDDKTKVDDENGASLEEKSDKYHDTDDIIGENHLLFEPIKEDWESLVFNMSNSSFMFDPLLHIESEVEPTDDVPMNEGVDIAEEKPIMVETGLGKTIFTINQIEGLRNTKQVDVAVERVEENNDELLNFEVKAHLVSLNDNFIGEERGDKGSDITVRKIENKDGISKVDGENGMLLDDKTYKNHDINGENNLISAPKKEDREESSMFSISSNPLVFDYTQSSDESGTEEEQDAFLKDLEQFHKNNFMEFKPPKFYGEGLNYLKLVPHVFMFVNHTRLYDYYGELNFLYWL
jgi:hypothetical protein